MLVDMLVDMLFDVHFDMHFDALYLRALLEFGRSGSWVSSDRWVRFVQFRVMFWNLHFQRLLTPFIEYIRYHKILVPSLALNSMR